ncbi:MAG: histone-like nucleoid-structuring protein Lsr2 [Mycobacteriales bacterium]|nr:MAG: nucleoid-associated protein Lsr2 [Pseudonocardiales bacterium]
MAQKVQILLIDDLDGGTADETIAFAMDGTAYEIDLSKQNAAGLRDAMATYVAHARKAGRGRAVANVGGGRRRGGASIDREQAKAIRSWARKNGHKVSERGRIAADVVEAFNTAN